jgi:hypothetical protein
MERWRERQTNLFEEWPRIAELPEPLRRKALMLLGSLLGESLARKDEEEETKQSREAGDDKDHG